MRMQIVRTYQENETLGNAEIYDDNENIIFNFHTIELPNKNNQQKISCIPERAYEVNKIISPTKGHCFLLKDVPGRSAVEIHIGNYAAGKKVDTEGCILPGMGFEDLNNDGNLDVVHSTVAMEKLLEILPDTFSLTIIS
jgi:hypothetical protein